MKDRFSDASKYAKTIYAVISIFVFLCLWQMIVSFTSIGIIMAGPVTVLGAFFRGIVEPIGKYTIIWHILWSLSRVMVGFALGAISGVAIGVLMGWYKSVEAFVRPLFEVIRPIPAIAWIPLSIVWFGLGESAKYFLIFLSAFSGVTMNAFAGARSVDPMLVGAAKMLGADDRQVFTTIVLPACVPHIFAGLQIGIGAAWATVVAAEMVRSAEGVGWVIIKGQESYTSVQIMVGIVGVGVIGFILANIMRWVEAKLCGWRERGKLATK